MDVAWENAPVSKTGMGPSVHRGFESPPLRCCDESGHRSQMSRDIGLSFGSSASGRVLCFGCASRSCWGRYGWMKSDCHISFGCAAWKRTYEERGRLRGSGGDLPRLVQDPPDRGGQSSRVVWCIETMACTGPGAMVGKPANVATDERCDRSPSGCRHGGADDPCGRGPLITISAPFARESCWAAVGLADARRVRRRRGPRAEPESIPARVRARVGGSCQAAVAAAANSSAGRCQPSVLRGRSLTSAAIRTTSSTVWMLRSVPFGK